MRAAIPPASSRKTPASRRLAVLAARAADAKQARDVVVLDVKALLVITDYFVIASGATVRQVKAIADAIEEELGKAGSRPVRREGERELRWLLLDFVDLVVHAFLQEEREFYELERLWSDAPRVAWAARPAARRRAGS
ncbi:MAG: ribosome silencing factor [Candidatus Binatia bacterium]